MTYTRSTLSVLMALALVACGQHEVGDAQQAAAASGAVAAGDHHKDPGMTALKPPSPDSVLYVIYQRDGDGAISYKVDGGAVVTYWYGHAFQVRGRQYFTGFATRSEGEPGPDSETGLMEPGHVAIGQATFTPFADEDKPWMQLDSDGFVGEFGANDQGDPVDTARKAESHETADGRLVLAVPTRRFAGGVATASYAVFLFDPDNKDALPFRRWGYLGSITTGSDNAAACEDGAVSPCASSSGTLTFGEADASGLPVLQVAQAGTTIAGPGDVHTLGAGDALRYTFDAKAGRYVQP